VRVNVALRFWLGLSPNLLPWGSIGEGESIYRDGLLTLHMEILRL
jgi:hypothetical protein